MIGHLRNCLGPGQWLFDPLVGAMGLILVSFCAYGLSTLMVSHHLQKYNTPESPYTVPPVTLAGRSILPRRLHPHALWKVLAQEHDGTLRRWYRASVFSFIMIFVAFFLMVLAQTH